MRPLREVALSLVLFDRPMLVVFGLLSSRFDPLRVLLFTAIGLQSACVFCEHRDEFSLEFLVKLLGGVIVPEPVGALSAVWRGELEALLRVGDGEIVERLGARVPDGHCFTRFLG